MRVCPVESLRPFAVLPAPLYVLLPENQKFLAVKGPLDFLTPAELDHFRGYEAFYYPEFVEKVLPFRDAARAVLQLLKAAPEEGQPPPAPFELSDAFVRTTAKLWGPATRIEPFFIAVFVSELCGFLTAEVMQRVRERDQLRYEQAILRSSWAVWLALHQGYLKLSWLRRLRESVFVIIGDANSNVFQVQTQLPEKWMRHVLTCDLHLEAARLQEFAVGGDQEKLACRAHRLADDLISEDAKAFSIFGAEGFVRDLAAEAEAPEFTDELSSSDEFEDTEDTEDSEDSEEVEPDTEASADSDPDESEDAA
jgi:hypothetical protein